MIGLGYVGLPIALEFARKISVIGFDINAKRIEMMKKSIDPSNELEKEAFAGCDIDVYEFTGCIAGGPVLLLWLYLTPVDDHNVPDLVPVQKASKRLAKW